jgi:hypothetical protein
MNIICTEYFLPQKKKMENRTLLSGSIPLKHDRHFGCLKKPMNTRMRVSYLDCHEADLCCNLVKHIEKITLQPAFQSERTKYAVKLGAGQTINTK